MVLSWMSYIDDNRTLWATVIEAIVQAFRNRFVVSGCEVTASTTDLSVNVAAGYVMYESVIYSVSATNLALAVADANYDRLDVVVWDYNAGTPTLKVVTGTRWVTDASGNYIPLTERITDEQIPLAIVQIPAGATVPGVVYDVRINVANLIGRNANKGNTSSVTVTETTLTLKQEVVPDTGFFGFSYIEGIHVILNNPTGSGATLNYEIRVLLDDGTEDVLVSDSLAEGGTLNDWLRWICDSVSNGRIIKAVRLYAYCDVAPVAGSEPTVQIERVTGVMV